MQKEPGWPDDKDEFAALTAQFDGLKDCFWNTSDLAEQAALLAELQFILLDAETIVQRQVVETWKHWQQIAREYGKLTARVNRKPQTRNSTC